MEDNPGPITVRYEAELHYPSDEIAEFGITEQHARENIIEMVMNNADVGSITVSRGEQ